MNGRITTKKLSIGLLSLGILLLPACSGNMKNVDCGVGKGARCKSVTKVNEMVSTGEIMESKGASKERGKVLKMSSISKDGFKDKSRDRSSSRSKDLDVVRLPEKTARVWVSGFEDESGDYVKETYVYTVLEGGSWNVK